MGNENHREMVFRKHKETNDWRRGTITVLEKTDKIYSIVVTFNVLDAITAEKEMLNLQIAEQKEVLRENLNIIEGLASEYSCVFYIDLEKNKVIPYIAEGIDEELVKVTKGGDYEKSVRSFIERLVSKNEIEKISKACERQNLIKVLTDQQTFDVYYLNNHGHYCLMKAVKVGQTKTPKYVALAFANKDDQVRKDMEREAIITSLSSDYSFVYVINPKDRQQKVYRYDKIRLQY